MTAIHQLITHLFYFGVVVFAVVGGYLSAQNHRKLRARGLLIWSLGLFGASLAFWLISSARLIELVTSGRADSANDAALRSFALLQIAAVLVGSILFLWYLYENIYDAHEPTPKASEEPPA